MRLKVSGFTIIELMISLALGLIVSAAALMLFLTAQRSVMMQQASAEIQSNGNFGLNYIIKDIRLANLDANSNLLNGNTIGGGVITNINNYPAQLRTVKNLPISKTTSGIASNLVGDIQGDQLVTQFKAMTDGFDCTGQSYSAGVYVVQRYFLREDSVAATNDVNKQLGFACEATTYTDGATAFRDANFGTTLGQLVIRRTDYFRVLLGTSNNTMTANFKYVPLSTYNGTDRIISVQIGLLVRSLDSVGSESLLSNNAYTVLDQAVTVKSDSNVSTRFVRKNIQQTIALRNAGVGVTDTYTTGVSP